MIVETENVGHNVLVICKIIVGVPDFKLARTEFNVGSIKDQEVASEDNITCKIFSNYESMAI